MVISSSPRSRSGSAAADDGANSANSCHNHDSPDTDAPASSNSSTKASSANVQGADQPWAAADEWSRHRPLIIRLYSAEQRTLGEVIEIMERDHHFLATPRMYKFRLKKWGITKYTKLPKSRLDDGRTASSSPGSSSSDDAQVQDPAIEEVEDKGRQQSTANRVAVRSVRSPVRRDSKEAALKRRKRAWEVAIARTLSDPDSQQGVQTCFRSLSEYVSRRCAADEWRVDADFTAALGATDWMAQACTACRLITAGDNETGFSMLGICLEDYKSLLERQDAMVVIQTYMVAFQLLSVSPQLYRSFLSYARDLAAIVFHKDHPLCLLFGGYLACGPEPFAAFSDLFLQSYLMNMAEHIPGWDSEQRNTLLLTVARLYLLSLVPMPDFQKLMRMSGKSYKSYKLIEDHGKATGSLGADEDIEPSVEDPSGQANWPQWPADANGVQYAHEPVVTRQESVRLLPGNPATFKIAYRGAFQYLTCEPIGGEMRSPQNNTNSGRIVEEVDEKD